ncbi:MAG: FecR family protein [Spirochaetota bacterium]
MRLHRSIILVALFAMLATAAFGQAAQTMILEFVDGTDLTVVYPDSTAYTLRSGAVQEGDSIPIGSSVRTGPSTSAEMRLSPNGTIIKLAKSTNFRIDGLATPQNNQNGFTLVAGKIRAVAAKGSNYNVHTSSTVAGVRGTDFTMAFEEGAKARLMVAKGAVEFGKLGAGGEIAERIMVGAGQFADLFAGFVPTAFTPEQFAQEFEDVDIAPEKMPPEPAVSETEEPAEDTESEEPAEGEGEAAEEEGDGTADAAVLDETKEETVVEEEAEAPEEENPIVTWLREILGMELGSITIGEQTYAKAVIQPTFTLGKLRMGLYLPIIYQSNLFDPADWYRPMGNDEWSFGTDIGWSDNTVDAAVDAASDLALKIRFLEFGRPLYDPFFIKIGNLDSFTVGHGLLMRNYANDSDFPSVRHLGLNLGLDLDKWGFEALTNDLLDNQIVGGRLFVRPVGKLAFGISAVADLGPAQMLNLSEDDLLTTWDDTDTAALVYGDPMFIGTAVDLDLPIVTSGLFSLRMFADGAAMVPYVRNEITEGSYVGMETGLRYDMLLGEDGQLRNWGATAGFMGNVLFIDWRLEYRYFTGVFKPAFFDSGYERRRPELLDEWAGYLSGTVAMDQSPSVMGVYGEGGASILQDKLSFSFGYFWPWAADAGSLSEQIASANDYFKAVLEIKQGLVPIVDLAGAITYERKNFISTLAGEGSATLFDENTVFSGEIIIPVPGAPNLNMALIVSTAMARNAAGDINILENGKPEIIPVVTLETRLRF